MKEGFDTIKKYALDLGLDEFRELDPGMLKADEYIRGFCAQDKCGSYGNNYTCPPHVGTIPEMAEKIGGYSRGYLFQYTRPMEMKRTAETMKAMQETRSEFQEIVLRLERYLKEQGETDIWGLIGGPCGLCSPCAVTTDEPCRFPEKARTSLEAVGINVVQLLVDLGMDGRFHRDRVTWTGCVLF